MRQTRTATIFCLILCTLAARLAFLRMLAAASQEEYRSERAPFPRHH
jgi:hypothetical protein